MSTSSEITFLSFSVSVNWRPIVNGGFCTAETITVGLLLVGSGDLQNPVTSPALYIDNFIELKIISPISEV